MGLGPLGSLFGSPGSTKELEHYATEPFERGTQRFLPPELRQFFTGPILKSGMERLAELIRNPGGLSPTISSAIAPRLAAESENIAENYRGIRGNQAGAAARGNVPLSIQGALNTALDIAQERAQRGSRREAMTESENLRRQDISRVFQLLDALLQFSASGRGTAVQGLSAASQANQGSQASMLGMLGSLFSSGGLLGGAGGAAAGAGAAGAAGGAAAAALPTLAAMAPIFLSSSKLKEGFEAADAETILDAVRALPVYEWSYRGDGTRHVGPMAEDFMAAFRVGDSPDHIHVVDAVGTLLAATQALARKVERLEARH